MDYVCFGETKDKHLNRSLRHGTEMRHRNLRPDSVRYIRFRYPTLGGAGGFGDQGVGGAQEGHGGAGATEDWGGAKEEPNGARGMKGRDVAGGVYSRGGGRETTDQGGAGGMREPSGAKGLTGSGGDEEAGSHGGAAGLQDWGGVEGSSRRSPSWRSADQRRAHATDGELSGWRDPVKVL